MRFVLAFLALGALVGATVAGVSAIDRALSARMADLKAEGIAALERLLGRRVAYRSISPSILRQIVVRDLAVASADGSADGLLTVRTLRIRYSLAGLLADRDPLGALREIRISGAVLRLDLEADRDLLDLVERLSSRDGGTSILPRLRLVGEAVDVDLAVPHGRLTGRSLAFEAGGAGERLEVSLRGTLAGRMDAGPWFRSALTARAAVARDFAAADATVRLLTLETPVVTARPQTFHASWDDGRLAVTKIEDRVPVDLAVVFDVASGDLTARMRAEGFRADQVARPAGGYQGLAPWFAAPVSGTAELSWRPADGSIAYKGELSADLADQLPIFRGVHVAAAFAGDRRRVSFDSLTATSPGGSLAFAGDVLLSNFWPEGTFTVTNLTGLPLGSVDTTITVERREGSLSLGGAAVRMGEVDFDLLKADLAPSASGLRFDVRASFADAAEGDLVHAAGELVTVGARRLSLSAELTGSPPDRLFHLARGAGVLTRQEAQIRALLSRLSVDATVALWTDFDRLVVTSPQLSVSSRDDPTTRLSTVFTMDRRSISLSGFAGSWQGFTVAGDASVKLADDGSARFGADLRFRDIPYSVAGSWSPRDGLALEGSYGLSAEVVAAEGGAWILRRARAERFPVPIADRVWRPTFDVSGELDPKGGWKLTGRLAVPDVDAVATAVASVEAAFEATPDRIDVRRLRYADGVSTLEGAGAVEFRSRIDPFASDIMHELAAAFRLELKAAGSAESYALAGTLAGGTLDARIAFASSPLRRFGSFGVRGELSGTGRLTGPFGAPEVSGSISLGKGMLATDPIAVATTVRFAGRRLEVENLSVTFLDHRFTGFAGHVDLAAGSLELAGRYQGVYFRDRVDLDAALQATVGAASSGGEAGPFGTPLEGRLDLTSIRVAGTPVPSWGVRLRTADSRLYLDGGPDDALHAWIDDRLEWVLLAQAPLPVTGRAEGRFKNTRLEADVQVTSVDLPVINSILKSPVVTITAGDASGRLAVAGPFNDPDFTGTLRLVGGALRFRYSPDVVGPVDAAFTFTGRTFSAGPQTVPVGNAWATATVQFTLDHWEPIQFVLDAATARDSAIRTAATFGRVSIDGRAASRGIRVAASDRRTDVTGSLTVNEARITLGEWIDVPFVPEEPPTFVSLQVTTGKRIEFFWPSETLPVVRTTASPGGRLAVTYRGDTGAYTVTGSAEVHGGEVFFFDRSFILKEGTITFKEDQRSFDPRITARAEIREWDPTIGEEVKIWLDVDDRLNSFSPRFSSDPALPEPQIFALLGAPFTQQVGGQGLLSSAVMLSSDVLSRFGLLRPFEQRVRELLGLDVFSVRTQVIQNILAEKVLGLAGGNPLDNTSLSLGKYLGDDLFLEMLVRLQAARGPSGLLLPGRGLSSEFELNLEWDTPFFLLEWSFLPRNPDALFLTDNSLALKWRYTY